MVPDEFPQDAADAHLFLRCEFLIGDGGVFVKLFHLMFLESQLHKLVAKVDESDARSVVAAIHDHHDSVSQFLVVVEEMHWICVVIHSCFMLVGDANIVFFSKQATFLPDSYVFLHLILICRADFVILQAIQTYMKS